MKWFYVALGIVVLTLVWVGWYAYQLDKMVHEPLVVEDIVPSKPDSPLYASYNIADTEVALGDGYAEVTSDGGGIETVQVVSEPLYDDLNGDGREDAALVLSHHQDAGTTYYLVIAVHDGIGFLGSKGVVLGDHIEQPALSLWHDVLVTQYRTYQEGEVADELMDEVTRYFTVEGAEIFETGPYEQGTEILHGHVVWQGGVHTFTPCDGEVRVIAEDSRASAALEVVYAERAAGRGLDAPVYMILNGSTAMEPEQVFNAMGIVSAPQVGGCDTLRTGTETLGGVYGSSTKEATSTDM